MRQLIGGVMKGAAYEGCVLVCTLEEADKAVHGGMMPRLCVPYPSIHILMANWQVTYNSFEHLWCSGTPPRNPV